MKFLKSVKGLVSETKQNIISANDKRKVEDVFSELISFPLCSADDAIQIVTSITTKYLGRSHISHLNFDQASSEEIARELEILKELEDKQRYFLDTIYDPEFRYPLNTLRGSISVAMLDLILDYIDSAEYVISDMQMEEILTLMVHEASGYDVYIHFLNADNELDLLAWHSTLKEDFFPDLRLPHLEEIAMEKLEVYKRNLESEDEDSKNVVMFSLSNDTIGDGKSMKLYNYADDSWTDGYLGHANVRRIIEYYTPELIEEKLVLSLRNLNSEMKIGGNLHWHFCQNGIIQLDLNVNVVPRWIPRENIKNLTFGRGYNALTSNGVTEFEHFYLYLIVKTKSRDEFILFKYLGSERNSVEKQITMLMNSTIPTLEDYYPISISNQVHDTSKHYKTTYTTSYDWGSF